MIDNPLGTHSRNVLLIDPAMMQIFRMQPVALTRSFGWKRMWKGVALGNLILDLNGSIWKINAIDYLAFEGENIFIKFISFIYNVRSIKVHLEELKVYDFEYIRQIISESVVNSFDLWNLDTKAQIEQMRQEIMASRNTLELVARLRLEERNDGLDTL